ncbi:MAG: transglutaminaseTgpA domain-containing protein [Ilumatobacteraceae bacterium]
MNDGLRPAPAIRTPNVNRLLHDVVGVVSLAAVNLATAVSFARIFEGWTFLRPLVVMVVLAHALAAFLRYLRVPFLVALPVLIVSVFVLVGHLSLSSTLRYGLPLGETWSSFSSQIGESWRLLGDVVPPVPQASGFGLVALVSLGLSAVLADSFAFRFGGRVEAFVPATVIFVVLAAVGMDRLRVPSAAIWIGSVLVAVAIVRARDRVMHILARPNAVGYRPARTFLRLALGGVVLGASIGTLAAIAGPRLPGASQEAWLLTRRQGDSRTLEPLVDVRRRLANPTDRVLFTVTAERSSYWRLTALPVFDGSTWTVPEDLLDDAGGDLAAVNPSPPVGLDVVPNAQRVTVTNLAGLLLPIAFEPIQLRSASRSLFYELRTGSVVVGGSGLEINDSYELLSNIVSPRPELLGAATATSPPTLDDIDSSYLEIPPSDEIDRLRQILTGVVDPSASPYEQALSLQSYFRDTFTYSLDVPTDLGAGATLAFIERRTGYCEQFSSTFALFARMLGIPARVAVGFTPGEVIGEKEGRSVYEVRSQHAHAWPELWFDGIGWVLFEPTPGRGAPNAGYTNVPEQQDETVPVPAPAAPATSTTAPAIEPSVAPPAQPDVPTTTVNDASGSSSSSMWRWAGGLAVIGLLWLVGLPTLMRKAARRRRTDIVLDCWRRVVALYEFERGPFDRSLSPREIANRATSRLWDEDPFIDELAAVVTEHLYAGRRFDSEESRSWQERTDTYLSTRLARLPWRTRMRARVDPWAVFSLSGLKGSRESATH